MRKLLAILIILFVLILESCSSIIPSDVIPYLQDSGIYTLSTYAHPTSHIAKYDYEIQGNNILISVLYESGNYIKFKLAFEDGYFTELEVVEDSDTFKPFLATRLLKTFTLGLLIDEERNDFISSFERKIGKKINNLSGEETTLYIMNWDYINFKKMKK